MKGEKISNIITEKQDKREYNYPKTDLAHVHKNFSAWELTDEVKQDLWDAVKRSPVNQRTNKHTLMASVINEGMIEFGLNMLCSLQMAGVDPINHVMIALDLPSYKAVRAIGANAIYFKSNFTTNAVNNRHLIQFYDIVKVRPTIVHQLLMWDVETILIDVDIIFISNPLEFFKDNADFEVQSDSKVYYKIPSDEVPVRWEVNLGFYKIHPSQAVLKLSPIWLTRMYKAPKVQDQSALRKILKPLPHEWRDNETISVDISSLIGDEHPNLTFRFLDPMQFVNAGGIWQEGKEYWKDEAYRRKISKPVMCHFFHIGFINEKLKQMKDEDLWFIDSNLKCLKTPPAGTEWPIWS